MRNSVHTESERLVTEFEEPGAVKATLRRLHRQRRKDRSAGERGLAADLLARLLLEMPAIRAARCVAAYASLPAEPGTGPLREALRARGVRVLLPIVLGTGTRTELDLDWAEDDGEDAPSGGMGGPEPAGPRLGRRAIGDADVVVTPALAIDRVGYRLGMGGGCYDRALPRTAAGALRLAVVHDDELLLDRELPAEPHDIPVDAVLTPSRWIYFSPRAAASGCAPRQP